MTPPVRRTFALPEQEDYDRRLQLLTHNHEGEDEDESESVLFTTVLQDLIANRQQNRNYRASLKGKKQQVKRGRKGTRRQEQQQQQKKRGEQSRRSWSRTENPDEKNHAAESSNEDTTEQEEEEQSSSSLDPTIPITEQFPHVLFAGVPKAGTTAITQYFTRQYPHRICLAQPQKAPGGRNIAPWTSKEPHFFDLLLTQHEHENTTTSATTELAAVAQYKRLYRRCHDARKRQSKTKTTSQTTAALATTNDDDGDDKKKKSSGKLLLDATPNYFTYPQEIHDFYQRHGSLSDLKIVIVLREPMSRELSWYHHKVFDFTQAYIEARGQRLDERTPYYLHDVVHPHVLSGGNHPNDKRNNQNATTEQFSNTNTSTRRQQISRTGTTTLPSEINGRRTSRSHYKKYIQQHLTDGTFFLTFEEYLQKILLPQFQNGTNSKQNFSFYVWWLKKWFQLFDRNQLFIASYHDFSQNQDAFLQDLTTFLNLPILSSSDGSAAAEGGGGEKNENGSTSTRTNVERSSSSRSRTARTERRRRRAATSSTSTTEVFERVNEKHLPQKDIPSCAVQQYLFNYFEPYNQELYQLLSSNNAAAATSTATTESDPKQPFRSETANQTTSSSLSSLSPPAVTPKQSSFPQFQFQCKQP